MPSNHLVLSLRTVCVTRRHTLSFQCSSFTCAGQGQGPPNVTRSSYCTEHQPATTAQEAIFCAQKTRCSPGEWERERRKEGVKERGSHLEDIVGLLTLKTWSPWIRIVSKHKRGTAQDRKEVIEQFENRNIKVCGWPRKCARSFMKDMLGVQCLPGARACSQFRDELKGFSLGLLSFVFQESSLNPFLIPPAHPSSVILLVCWTTLLKVVTWLRSIYWHKKAEIIVHISS